MNLVRRKVQPSVWFVKGQARVVVSQVGMDAAKKAAGYEAVERFVQVLCIIIKVRPKMKSQFQFYDMQPAQPQVLAGELFLLAMQLIFLELSEYP